MRHDVERFPMILDLHRYIPRTALQDWGYMRPDRVGA